jgi:hypothetical protein
MNTIQNTKISGKLMILCLLIVSTLVSSQTVFVWDSPSTGDWEGLNWNEGSCCPSFDSDVVITTGPGYYDVLINNATTVRYRYMVNFLSSAIFPHQIRFQSN